ncbi:uncharacterized protein [Antedon mediterranea]|uniref:uncharacterized protein n=1 Tax=Antedon mediterranea TaxID=105859 RepID=UPI003AF580D9
MATHDSGDDVAAIDILNEKLQRAKESLHTVDENIRKFTGKEFGEKRSTDQRKVAVGIGRGPAGPRNRGARTGSMGTSRLALSAFERLGAPLAKRPNRGSAFSRLGNRVDAGGPRMGVGRRRREEDEDFEEELPHKPALSSSVVAPSSITRTRKDSIEEQSQDSKGTARNRRMFGLLLGTLQKFKDDSVQKSDKDIQREEIEHKLDARAKKEKQEIASERRELFTERRNKQKELERLEELMEIAKEQEMWDKHSQTLGCFIQTKAKPPLFYRPRKVLQEDEKKLAATKEMLGEMASKRREAIEEEIKSFEGFGKPRSGENREKENEEMKQENEEEEENEERKKRRRDSDRGKDGEREKRKEKERGRVRARSKDRDHREERDTNKEEERKRERSKDGERRKERERGKDGEGKERNRSRDGEHKRERSKDGEQKTDRSKDAESKRDRSKDRESRKGKDRNKDEEKESKKEKDRSKDGESRKESEQSREEEIKKEDERSKDEDRKESDVSKEDEKKQDKPEIKVEEEMLWEDSVKTQEGTVKGIKDGEEMNEEGGGMKLQVGEKSSENGIEGKEEKNNESLTVPENEEPQIDKNKMEVSLEQRTEDIDPAKEN